MCTRCRSGRPLLSVPNEASTRAVQPDLSTARIGNAELVRGVSAFYSIVRLIDNQAVSSQYVRGTEPPNPGSSLIPTIGWMTRKQARLPASCATHRAATAELVIDEFEKVQSIRAQSSKTMAEAEAEQQEILRAIRP